MTEQHTRYVETQDLRDKSGKLRKTYKIFYKRSEQAERDAELRRLGSFAEVQQTKDISVLALAGKRNLVVVAPYFISRVIAATMLRQNRRPHVVLTGSDVLQRSFDKNYSLWDGFSVFPQLYVFFGYVDAPNKYLPSLIVQLMGQRFHEGRQAWLFMPAEPITMVKQWTEAMHGLSYLERVRIEALADYKDSRESPCVTTTVERQKGAGERLEGSIDLKSGLKSKGKKWKRPSRED